MKRHYLILIMLSLVGCDSSSQEVSTYEEGESRPVREASPENQNDDSEQYNELGLDDIYNGFANKTAAETLNYFCHKAGGDFDPINYNCVCPEGKTYLGFKYAACVKYNEITEWDSIGHMTLMSGLEEGFSITLETDDIVDFSSFKKGIEILKKYSVNF